MAMEHGSGAAEEFQRLLITNLGLAGGCSAWTALRSDDPATLLAYAIEQLRGLLDGLSKSDDDSPLSTTPLEWPRGKKALSPVVSEFLVHACTKMCHNVGDKSNRTQNVCSLAAAPGSGKTYALSRMITPWRDEIDTARLKLAGDPDSCAILDRIGNKQYAAIAVSYNGTQGGVSALASESDVELGFAARMLHSAFPRLDYTRVWRTARETLQRVGDMPVRCTIAALRTFNDLPDDAPVLLAVDELVHSKLSELHRETIAACITAAMADRHCFVVMAGLSSGVPQEFSLFSGRRITWLKIPRATALTAHELPCFNTACARWEEVGRSRDTLEGVLNALLAEVNGHWRSVLALDQAVVDNLRSEPAIDAARLFDHLREDLRPHAPKETIPTRVVAQSIAGVMVDASPCAECVYSVGGKKRNFAYLMEAGVVLNVCDGASATVPVISTLLLGSYLSRHRAEACRGPVEKNFRDLVKDVVDTATRIGQTGGTDWEAYEYLICCGAAARLASFCFLAEARKGSRAAPATLGHLLGFNTTTLPWHVEGLKRLPMAPVPFLESTTFRAVAHSRLVLKHPPTIVQPKAKLQATGDVDDVTARAISERTMPIALAAATAQAGFDHMLSLPCSSSADGTDMRVMLWFESKYQEAEDADGSPGANKKKRKRSVSGRSWLPGKLAKLNALLTPVRDDLKSAKHVFVLCAFYELAKPTSATLESVKCAAQPVVKDYVVLNRENVAHFLGASIARLVEPRWRQRSPRSLTKKSRHGTAGAGAGAGAGGGSS